MANTITRVNVVRTCKKSINSPYPAIACALVLMALLSACAPSGGTAERVPVQDTIPQARHALNPAATERVTHYMDSLAGRHAFNGVALFAHEDSFLILTRGRRDLKTESPLQTGDVFQLASLSKPITAYAVLLLVHSGRLRLDADVKDYIPGFPYPGVKVHQLLTHSSGLGNYAYVTDSLWGMPDSFMCNNDLMCMLLEHNIPVYYKPGAHFDYCNTNYALLASLAETASGMTFHDFVRSRVFEPLGMFSTRVINTFDRSSAEYKVLGHYPNGESKLPFYLDGVVGDKGVYSNVFDLYKFYMELKHPTLLPDSLVALSMEPHVRVRTGNFYGLGWRVRPFEEDTIVFHNGWWRGFRSYFWFSKHDNKVAIILTNSIRGGYLSQEELWPLF